MEVTKKAHVTNPNLNIKSFSGTNEKLFKELEKVEEFVKQNKEPVNYEKMIGKSKVVFASDNHTSISTKEEIINNLKLFKELGITVVALEMFDEKDQKILDNYFADRATKKDLEKALYGWEKGPGIIDEYIKIVDKCKELGIRVIGIDTSGEVYRRNSLGSTLEERNNKWVYVTNRALKEDPHAKALVFGGSAHFGDNQDTANKIAERYGIPYTVIEFIGIEKSDNRTYYFYFPDFDSELPIAIDRLGLENEKFELPKKERHFLVHLPQVEDRRF